MNDWSTLRPCCLIELVWLGRVIDWLIDWLTVLLIDWLFYWLFSSDFSEDILLIDWLIDGIVLYGSSRLSPQQSQNRKRSRHPHQNPSRKSNPNRTLLWPAPKPVPVPKCWSPIPSPSRPLQRPQQPNPTRRRRKFQRRRTSTAAAAVAEKAVNPEIRRTTRSSGDKAEDAEEPDSGTKEDIQPAPTAVSATTAVSSVKADQPSAPPTTSSSPPSRKVKSPSPRKDDFGSQLEKSEPPAGSVASGASSQLLVDDDEKFQSNAKLVSRGKGNDAAEGKKKSALDGATRASEHERELDGGVEWGRASGQRRRGIDGESGNCRRESSGGWEGHGGVAGSQWWTD